MRRRMWNWITQARIKQNEKLLKNIERYEQEKKIKQQESKVYGQKPVKEKRGKEKSTIL
jgi:hypothetical protein